MSGHQHIFEDVTHTQSTYTVINRQQEFIYYHGNLFLTYNNIPPKSFNAYILKGRRIYGAMTMLGDPIRINPGLMSNNVKINLHTLG
jgi:hypothetical protein